MTIADVVREQVLDKVIDPADRRYLAHIMKIGIKGMREHFREWSRFYRMPEEDAREFLELLRYDRRLTVANYYKIKEANN